MFAASESQPKHNLTGKGMGDADSDWIGGAILVLRFESLAEESSSFVGVAEMLWLA